MLNEEATMQTIRHSFKAMGTSVELIAAPESDPRAAARAAFATKRVFAREETRFSRFRPESELSRVNAQAGRWVRVSKPFAVLTRRALQAAEETGGRFDPTVLPALKAAGYDRDFKEVVARATSTGTEDDDLGAFRREVRDIMVKNATACGAWREIALDGDRLWIPEGAELDFGGIAKGWTVDLAAKGLSSLPWAILDAGGDLRIVGATPEEGLDIAVEDPQARGIEALRLRLRSGALATTSVTVRAWGPGMHHVIDPATGLPALTPVVQATVWAETCTEAEVWSKAAVLMGPAILEHVLASLVMESGEILTNFTGAEPVEEQPLEEVAG
jgi:thiamine biosynthesis lipoprotein